MVFVNEAAGEEAEVVGVDRGIGEHGQRVDVGALELRVLAMLEEQAGKRMEQREFLQYLGVGARAGLRPLDHR